MSVINEIYRIINRFTPQEQEGLIELGQTSLGEEESPIASKLSPEEQNRIQDATIKRLLKRFQGTRLEQTAKDLVEICSSFNK